MSDSIPSGATTWSERSDYWVEVFDEARNLSHEQFHKEHEIVAGLIGLGFKWYVDGYKLEMAMDELVSIFMYAAVPMLLYLVGWFLFNFARAIIRVPVHRQREANRLVQEREKEVEKLKSTHQQTEDTLHRQIITLKDQLDTRSRRREQRETLARYLTRSNELRNIYTSPEDIPSEPRDEWAYGVANYLRTSFDESYFARWNDSTGITSHFVMEKEVSKENQRSLRDIYWRTLRLRELIADLKD